MAIEVSEAKWTLLFSDRKAVRLREVAAWDAGDFDRELAKAKQRFALGPHVSVVSCYEAGRVGFSLHRFLASRGVENRVVDPGSIEVSRGRKHRKTDRLDVTKLLQMLLRYEVYGEKTTWRVCRVPTPPQEAERRGDREHDRLQKERKGHVSRIRSLLATQGARAGSLKALRPGAIRDGSGALLAPALQEEIGRELERLAVLARERAAALRSPATPAQRDAAKLKELRGIGPIGSMALATQFFSWRDFRTVREVGAAAGLTGCPYDSGARRVEQGISKAGSRRIRTLAVELAWMWLRFQPDSALSQWYFERFGGAGRPAKGGGPQAKRARRLRRIGIVALARKLRVALWKWLRFDTLPERAVRRVPALP